MIPNLPCFLSFPTRLRRLRENHGPERRDASLEISDIAHLYLSWSATILNILKF